MSYKYLLQFTTINIKTRKCYFPEMCSKNLPPKNVCVLIPTFADWLDCFKATLDRNKYHKLKFQKTVSLLLVRENGASPKAKIFLKSFTYFAQNAVTVNWSKKVSLLSTG